MAKKSALFGGRTIKVENRSGFDKSFLNLLTSGVGTITPILKQLVIPSSGRCKIPIHVELPPLAADAYLRTHLKMEAFFCPLRLCYGGFESWFSGEPIDDNSGGFTRAKLPRAFLWDEVSYTLDGVTKTEHLDQSDLISAYGASSLTDFFDVRLPHRTGDHGEEIGIPNPDTMVIGDDVKYTLKGLFLNVFPYLCYHLIYDHFYRNKSVTRPAFVAPTRVGYHSADTEELSQLPYINAKNIITVFLGSGFATDGDAGAFGDMVDKATNAATCLSDYLINGHRLFELRQRNFGDDYFTAAKPTAQDGSPVVVNVSSNQFTIAAIRLQNALQEFSENQGYATPDFIQTLSARYGSTISNGVAQKPICLGSADFPIYTKSVEMATNSQSAETLRNPFTNYGILGGKAGVASGNGAFSFDFNVNEPGYIMVMATLVPEANYATGVSRDMRNFIAEGSLVDLPCGLLEHVGDEPIKVSELNLYSSADFSNVFGYVQRYLWHKAGNFNTVHGLFRKGYSLESFAPQRAFDTSSVQISSAFLEVPTTALDEVAAVESGVSQYGVMMDCAIELFVSEPLSESALPALVNPALEHGRSIYLQNGGSKFA